MPQSQLLRGGNPWPSRPGSFRSGIFIHLAANYNSRMASKGTSAQIQNSPDSSGKDRQNRPNASSHLTLQRLAVFLLILMVLAGIGIALYWQFAYSPQARARNILAEVRGEKGGFRGWLIAHGVIKKFPPHAIWEGRPVDGKDAALPHLVNIGRDALPELTDALKDPDHNIQSLAADACGAIGDPKAAPALLQALWDPDPEVRAHAIGALAKCWGKEAVPALIGMLDDECTAIHYHAALWLGNLGDRRAIEPLIACMEDTSQDDYVRAEAGGAVARLHEQKGFDFLCDWLKSLQRNDKDKEGRRLVIDAFAQTRDKRALAPLIAAANDEYDSVREGVAYGLGDIGDKQAIPTLRTMLKDPNISVRAEATEAMRKLGATEDFTKQIYAP
jgi:HEAT repeat protein